jgi:hypothetical protein
MEDTDYQPDQSTWQEPPSRSGLGLPPHILWPAVVLPPLLAIVSWALGGDTLWLLGTVLGVAVLAFGSYTLRGELERPRKKGDHDDGHALEARQGDGGVARYQLTDME